MRYYHHRRLEEIETASIVETASQQKPSRDIDGRIPLSVLGVNLQSYKDGQA